MNSKLGKRITYTGLASFWFTSLGIHVLRFCITFRIWQLVYVDCAKANIQIHTKLLDTFVFERN